MNTPWNYSVRGWAPAPLNRSTRKPAFMPNIRMRLAYRWMGWPLTVAALAGGCGQSQGELLYMLGVGRGQLVEAKFRLTEKPLLILLDDPTGRMNRPVAKHYFVDEVGQELVKHGAAKKIIPRQTLQNLRQAETDFEGRGCREVGELAGAEQVLWVQVRDFVGEEYFYDTNNAAYFTVTIKVINVRETHRSRVRLWPTSPNGHLVTVSMTGSEVTLAKTKAAIGKELARRLAVKVAKLFYDHRLGDFERES